ncbi:methyltransferase domain-containing protein [Brevibacillus sp. H7]|uniref:methyltransferase domain-containing protein n=1 Tax=Brevibacillus sp. H7 TaxID=3349138 RepID=UPI0037FA6AD0
MHIQEMAKRLQITPRAIRFYEEKGLIAPQKAAVSGYRQFTEGDVWRLQTVITLREVGMPLGEIKQLLHQLDEEKGSLKDYLELQRSYMYDRWVEMSNVIQTTEAMIERVTQDSSLDPASLFELAEANKRLRQARKNWVDRWNFNQIAPVYDELVLREREGFHPHEGYDQVLAEVVAAIDPQPSETGLDAGTGTGNLARCFTEKGVAMCAFDQSPEMLKRCQQKNPQVETKLGTFFAFPYLENRFDFVVSSYALHHLTDDQKCLALGECKRVLKPTGKLAVADFMFCDERHRQAHYDELRRSGNTEAICHIEDEFYADRSRLIAELQRLGFQTETRQLNTYVHLILARLG